MELIVCAQCGEMFQSDQVNKKYCGDRCREIANDLRNNPRIGLAGYQITKKCMVCGADFLTKSKSPEREKYCSTKCRTRANNQAHYARRQTQPDRQKVCVVCQAEFQSERYHPNQITCSQKCNRIRQNEIARGGRVFTARHCTECGKEFIPERGTQVCCSNDCSRKRAERRAREKGKGKHSWYGHNGLRRNRVTVMERDKVCQECGQEGNVVHHKDGSGETDTPNHLLDNLVLLCARCHKEIHTINYRIIEGKIYVIGKIFDAFDSVEIMRGEQINGKEENEKAKAETETRLLRGGDPCLTVTGRNFPTES